MDSQKKTLKVGAFARAGRWGSSFANNSKNLSKNLSGGAEVESLRIWVNRARFFALQVMMPEGVGGLGFN